MSNPPLVSVLTAAYNAEPYIRETIESVLQQGYGAIEYIVVDDGSTDGTASILRDYAARDRLRLIEQANRGEAAALNRAFQEATGDFILALSADDLIRPQLLEQAVAALRDDEGLGAVYPDWDTIDDASNVIAVVRPREYSYEAMLVQHMCLPGPGTVIRRKALEGQVFRDPAYRFKGDFDLWLRIGLNWRLRRLPGRLAAWRRHPAGATKAGRGRQMAGEHIALIAAAFDRAGNQPALTRRRDLAFSVAHYAAGLHALHSPEVAGKEHMWESLRLAPVWPADFHPETRRAWSRVAYIFGLPASRWVYRGALAAGLPLPRG
jgi:glycosyltransferase involved in cell wall biosynthesis